MIETKIQHGSCVSLKDENLFLGIKGSREKIFEKLDETEIIIEKFLRLLEKYFHEVAWYIGTDYINDNICERFMFAKSGFMEIYLGKNEINAYFPTKAKADKFAQALKKALIKLKKSHLSHKIIIK